MIKFVDVAAQNREIRCDVDNELASIHRQGSYIDGPQVAAFEDMFAEFIGVPYVVGMGSGTDALRIALLAAGIGPGDEVLTSPMTFIATSASILQTGAHPVFVDVDSATGNLSPAALIAYLDGNGGRSSKVRAIVPVHLYGMPAAMDDIRAIAKRHGLIVIEDACQAHGARMRGANGWESAGAMGAAGCFSFYPGKNLGAWGEAGAIATYDLELAERMRRLRNHGRVSHYAHAECGYNARLDTIQAAVLSAKLRRLRAWNERRREIAVLYSQALADSVSVPIEPPGFESCFHLYVIRTPYRDKVRQELLKKGIECGIHYPVPLHLQPAFKSDGYRQGDFPVSERMADTILSLPIHPHLTDAEVSRVAEIVRRAARAESTSEPLEAVAAGAR